MKENPLSNWTLFFHEVINNGNATGIQLEHFCFISILILIYISIASHWVLSL